MEILRPIDDKTEDGRKIVYPIWRDDLAEAIILPNDDANNEKLDRKAPANGKSGLHA